MARANITWALTHRCCIGGGKYQCECGHISVGEKAHNQHMLEVHRDNIPLIYMSVKWKVWEKWAIKYGWEKPTY